MTIETLDLFGGPRPNEHLIPYWKDQLRECVRDLYEWRHYVNTTAWSCATGFYGFARVLFRCGELSRAELRRYFRLDRRARRWEERWHAREGANDY